MLFRDIIVYFAYPVDEYWQKALVCIPEELQQDKDAVRWIAGLIKHMKAKEIVNMKKRIFTLTILATLLLTGCNSTETPKESTVLQTTPQQSTAQQSTAQQTTPQQTTPQQTTPQQTTAQSSTTILISSQSTESSVHTATDLPTEYTQAYPVQPFQKAYAQFLSEPNNAELHSDIIYLIHVDGDTTPELVLMPDYHTAIFYSFDGAEVYEVGTTGLDSYNYNFLYRPYLNMISYGNGSVMFGNIYKTVKTFITENGRLQLGKAVNIADTSSDAQQEDESYLVEYKDTIPFDMGQEGPCSYGSSWRTIEEKNRVTQEALEYWLAQ